MPFEHQNGLKLDQDIVQHAIEPSLFARTQRWQPGEYVCFDVHPFRPTKVEHWLAHLDNSRRTFLRLVEKACSFNDKKAQGLIADRISCSARPDGDRHLLGRCREKAETKARGNRNVECWSSERRVLGRNLSVRCSGSVFSVDVRCSMFNVHGHSLAAHSISFHPPQYQPQTQAD
jgi:hypothetical protein